MAAGRHRVYLTVWQRIAALIAVVAVAIAVPAALVMTHGPSASAASANAPAQAIQWAKGKLGTNYLDGACLQFVYEAYAKGAGVDTKGGMATNYNTTAYQFWNHFPNIQHRKDTNPPAGAFVFWGPKPGYPEGHVALAEGGGKVISTAAGNVKAVHEYTIASRPEYYLGWFMPVGVAAPSAGASAPTSYTGQMAGSLDIARRAPGGIAIYGWGLDADTTQPIRVDTYAGDGRAAQGNPGLSLRADASRPDVAKAHPGYGDRHGFSGVVPDTQAGAQTVCAYGINTAGTPGGTTKLGCKTVTISNQPSGSLDKVEAVRGGVNFYGWAFDPDTDAAIRVDLYGGDGLPRPGVNPGVNSTASGYRPDVANAYPGYSAQHGYGGFLPLPTGIHTVCAYGINAAGTPGANPQLGCKSVTVT